MREIKFRAFVKDIKKMIYNNHSAMSVKMFTPNYAYLNSEVEVMQYTGLKDKNGVEIFEGDFVSTDLSRPFLIVEYRNGAFMYQCRHNGQDYYDHMEPAFEDEKKFTKYHAVIGNIYENPELLEE
jgi:uncharacterized phage protein (TIGR01671 family)